MPYQKPEVKISTAAHCTAHNCEWLPCDPPNEFDCERHTAKTEHTTKMVLTREITYRYKPA